MGIPVFDDLRSTVLNSGLTVSQIANGAKVGRMTLVNWLDGKTSMPRIDTMVKVAQFLGQHIELTDRVRKMVGYYPPPKKLPRFQLWRLH
jgi:transcriptional regulator with XRE-family HTH domain